jgi:hypothetical protein
MAKKRKGSLLNPSGYTPGQVRQLHRQGFNVRGYIPGAPDALQPRLQSFLTKQAKRTIGTAYAGAEQELDSRTSRAKAIMAKRQRDNEAFQTWLTTQQASLRAEDNNRNAQLQATIAQHQQDTKNAMLQVQSNAATNLAAQHVASGSVDSGGVVTGAQNAAIESGAARATALTEGQNRSSNLLAANQANAMAFAKAQESKDFARSLQELADVADEGTKLKLQKGADMAKEISHLLDQEIAKAQQNAQLQVAGQKLGVQMAGIRQRDRANQRTTGTAKRGQNLQFQLGLQKIQQDNDDLSERQRHDRAQERNARQKLAKTDPKAASKQERSSRTAAIRATNRIKSLITAAMGPGKHPHGKQEDLNNVLADIRSRYPNDVDLISLAIDLWRTDHLSKNGKRRWKQEYGYTLPSGW